MAEFLSEKDLNEIKRLDLRTIALWGFIGSTALFIIVAQVKKAELLKQFDIDDDLLEAIQITAAVILAISGVLLAVTNFKLYQVETTIYNLIFLLASIGIALFYIIDAIVAYLDIEASKQVSLGAIE